MKITMKNMEENLNPEKNGNLPSAQPQNKPDIKGKGTAIAAFVLSLFVFGCFFAGAILMQSRFLLSIYPEFDHASSTIFIVYRVILVVSKLLCILSIIVGIIVDILLIFAYIGHGKNVTNGVISKAVLAFSIIATILTKVALFVLFMMLI